MGGGGVDHILGFAKCYIPNSGAFDQGNTYRQYHGAQFDRHKYLGNNSGSWKVSNPHLVPTWPILGVYRGQMLIVFKAPPGIHNW